MPRVVISPDAVQGQSITVTDPGELHHLLDVLRVKNGDRLECLDGVRHRYAGQIVQCTRREVRVRIEACVEELPPVLRLAVAQALIKPERFDWVVQKSTELGVEQLTPLITEHTVVRLARDQAEQKVRRWQRIAREAAKQCGRSSVPQIDSAQPFAEFAPTLTQYPAVLMPTLSVQSRPLRNALGPLKGIAAAMTLIGPEGDFTSDEVALAQRYGAIPVSLGTLTLRSETAAIAMLAVLHHTLGPS